MFKRKKHSAMIFIGLSLGLSLICVLEVLSMDSGSSHSVISHSYDDLPLVDNHRNSSKGVRHIYFHETSTRGYLAFYESCAIESAAIKHPLWQINVVFSIPGEVKIPLHFLKVFTNVKFWRENLYQRLHTSPLIDLDVLRLNTLKDWDGVYLDMGMLLVKPLDRLSRNFVAMEFDGTISLDILAISSDQAGRDVIAATTSVMASNRTEPISGAEALTLVLQQRCNRTRPSKMTLKACKGFDVYGPVYFYLVSKTTSNLYHFKQNRMLSVYDCISDLSYGYRFYSDASDDEKNYRFSNFEMLARKYCPYTEREYQYLYSTGAITLKDSVK